eukprot:TRINITY_DN39529_c0_g1_i1.p1 TRINITY_DN39529_c0_g1~~TRINITY_DN39529_c0_g1_i1.p1  ORF type:complete len:817 (+),score=235.29 TRINITY_DN39529_c0_g1_i1:50-2500(+)
MLGTYDLRKNFKNGDKYCGEAVETGVKHGRGSFTWGATGSTYTGQWVRDRMTGKGKLRDVPRGFTFEGDFRDGQRHGKGRCCWDDGTEYTGDWVNDVRQGSGSQKDCAGAAYEGAFEADRMHGRGSCRYANGDVYEGGWRDGVWEGRGRLLHAEAGTEYVGEVVRGEVTGQGTLSHREAGWTYEGEVLCGQQHGRGLMKWRSGESYDGEWVSGLRHGSGRASLPREWEYSGAWVAGKWEGQGRVVRAGIHTYEGTFRAGVEHGDGKAVAADGSWEYTGGWAGGQWTGRGSLLQRVSQTLPLSALGVGDVQVRELRYDGSLLAGLPDGDGDAIFGPAGVRYTGGWRRGLMHGAGELVYDRERVYTGEFEGGEFHGDGVLKCPGRVYKGTMRSGAISGYGRLDLANGDYYQGTLTDGSFDGKGTWYEAASGDSYDGYWKMGVKHGDGTEIKYGHYHYRGCFVEGVKDGHGTIKFTSGDRYDGGFKNGVYHHRGVLELADGSRYEGQFEDGKRHGIGEEKLRTGCVYKGDYVEDVWQGEGTLSMPSGDRFEGQFVDGQKEGKGRYFFGEGSRLDCFWKADVLHGQGAYYPPCAGPPTLRTYHQGALADERPLHDAHLPQPLPTPAAPTTGRRVKLTAGAASRGGALSGGAEGTVIERDDDDWTGRPIGVRGAGGVTSRYRPSDLQVIDVKVDIPLRPEGAAECTPGPQSVSTAEQAPPGSPRKAPVRARELSGEAEREVGSCVTRRAQLEEAAAAVDAAHAQLQVMERELEGAKQQAHSAALQYALKKKVSMLRAAHLRAQRRLREARDRVQPGAAAQP